MTHEKAITLFPVLALVLVLALVILLKGESPALAGKDPARAKAAATEAAQAWLKLVDAGRHGESWDKAARLFKKAVTKEQWEGKLKAVRPPLGKVVSRTLESAEYTESLPGAPDGKYVVIQFRTEFEHKKSAVETVTPMADPDGVWRVAGYFIR